ncbi:MAG TPA: PKD domain-containing protein [Nitrososphaera sp.]
MRIPPAILSISLVAVLAGSLILTAPFSIIDIIIPKQSNNSVNKVQAQDAEAQTLPLMIRDRFAEKLMAGDAAAAGSRFFKVDENFVDPENHCEFCTRVEYTPGSRGIAGFAYQDLTGLDLSNARKAQFWVMGEEGGERIRFKLAGKSLDRIQDRVQERLGRSSDGRASEGIFTTERFALTTRELTLDDDWKKYEVDLTAADLRDITHPFAFELSGNGNEKEVIYIKGVVYDDQPAEDPLATVAGQLAVDPLAAEVISNGTEGVAPATFEFEANFTGGTEPYSISWDFDDNNPSQVEGQNVVHTFEEAGEYNVTLAATDAEGQKASSSIVIQVAESEIIEEDWEEISEGTTNNGTLTNANTTATELETGPLEESIPDEQNVTEE